MRELHTIEVERWAPGEKQGMVKRVGMISPQEAFDALEKHLKEVDLLPDEYFLSNAYDWKNVKELPVYIRASCDVNWGGSEGIYLDISLLYRDENQQLQHFNLATGKTLGTSGDDFLRMSRIAAECSMMLNGRGEIVRFREEEKEQIHSNEVAKEDNLLKGDYFQVEKAIKTAYLNDDVDLDSHFATCKAPDMTVEDVVRLYSDLKQEIDGDQVFAFREETREVKALWSLDEPFYSKTEIADLFANYVGSENKDHLMAFIEQEVPFRLRELNHIGVTDETIDSLINAVKENTDVMFNYDGFDNFLMEKLQEAMDKLQDNFELEEVGNMNFFDVMSLPYQAADLVATYEELYSVPSENCVTEWFGDYGMHVFKSHDKVPHAEIETMYQKALNAIGMSSEEFLSNKDKFVYRGEIKALMKSMMVESSQPEISSVQTENSKPSLDESIKTAKDMSSKRSNDSVQRNTVDMDR